MTKLILKTGDLFSTDAPGIGHGVNTSSAMGAGVARLFRRRFVGMYDRYRGHCQSGALVAGGMYVWQGDGIRVYNLASQDKPGPNARLSWLESSVRLALSDCDARGLDRLALPRIGCGIGGLDWADVGPLLEAIAAEYTCDLEVWTL